MLARHRLGSGWRWCSSWASMLSLAPCGSREVLPSRWVLRSELSPRQNTPGSR